MLGLTIEKTGQSGSTIGRAYSTIFQRITKASKTSGTLEEDISKAETSLRAVGVEVRDDAGEFRDVNDIMSELAGKWDTLTDVEKSNISYNVAGTRQTNILKQLMSYYSEYESLVDKANNATGTTEENQEKYADSLTGKLNELSAIWTTIANQTIDSGFLSGILDIGVAISELIEKFGLLQTAMVALGAVGTFAFFSNFETAAGIIPSLLGSITGAVGNFSAGVILAFESITAFFASNPMVLAAALLVAGLTAVTVAVNNMENQFDKAVDSANNARSAYESVEAEIQELEVKKSDLRSEVEQMATEHNITFTDSDSIQDIIDKLKNLQLTSDETSTLSGLESQNALLEAQLELKQQIAAYDQQQAAKEAAKVLGGSAQGGTDTNWNVLKTDYNESNGSKNYGTYSEGHDYYTGSIIEETLSYQAQQRSLGNEITEGYRQQAEYTQQLAEYQKQGLENSKEAKEIQTLSDNLASDLVDKQEEYDAETEQINDNLDLISANYASLFDENGNILPGYETLVAQIQQVFGLEATAGEQAASSAEETASATEEAVSAVEEYTNVLANAQTAQANLQSAIKDSNSATGVTSDDITNISEAFGELEDYDPELLFERTANGIRLNSDALEHYNEELEAQTKQGYYDAIIAKQKELNEAQLSGASDEVISGLQDELTELEYLSAQYDGLTSKYNKYVEATSSANNRDSFESIASGYESVGELIEQGWTTDDSVTSYLDLMLGTDRIQDSQQAYAKLSETIEGTTHSLKDYFTTDESGNLTSQGAWQFVDDIATKLGDDYVKMGEDGSYSLDLTGDKLQDVADAFGTTTEFVELLGRALADAGMDVNFDSDEVQNYNEKISELTENTNQAHEALQELQDSSETNILGDIDLNYDAASMSIDEITAKIDELTSKRNEIDISTEEGQQAVATLDDEIQALSEQRIMLEIGAQLDGGATVQDLLGLSDAELQETLHINTDEVATARSALESLASSDVETAITVKLDESQFNSLTGTTSTTVNVTPVVTSQPTFDDATVNVTATCDTPPTIPDATGIANMTLGESPTEVPDASGTANYSLGTHPTVAPSISGVANYSAKFNFSLSAPTIYGTAVYTKTTATANGTVTAHADGTAYNMLNMKRITPSHATGDITLPNNEQALVNEIGQESIVRDGVWYMLPAHPHIENLKKGDIVFSAQQTADLLNHGKANNYARALAGGTLNAYGLTGTGNNPWRTTSSGSSSSSSGSSSKSSSSSSSYSSASSRSSYTSASTSSSSTANSSSSTSDDFEQQMDYIEIALTRINEAIERVRVTAESTFKSLSNKNTAAADEIALITKQIDLQEQAYEKYMKEANALGLSSSYVTKIQNGSIELQTIKDEDLYDKVKEYQELYEKAIEAKDEVANLHESMAQLYSDMFDNISEDYENKLSIVEHLTNTYQSGLDQLEAAGMMGATSYYQFMIDAEKDSIKIMQSELTDLQNSFKSAMESGEIEKYSDEWYEMQTAINDVRESLDDSTKSLLEYQSQMRELNWEYFEYAEDRISAIADEADFLIELLDSSDLFNDNGTMNENGLASLGLHGEKYNLYMAQADDYAKMVSELNSEIANNPGNKDLVEQRDEYLELQQKSIKYALDEKEAITDLVRDGYDAQIDALNDLVDSYEDSLDSAKDLYDYQKNIKKQTAEIASIQKQLAAYQNDTSEETKAKVQKLQVDLSDAMDELQEDQYDQYVSDQKKLLDGLVEDYENTLNERLDDVDTLISDCIETINANSADIANTIYSMADEFGYSISDSNREIWDNDGYAGGLIAEYGDNFSEQLTSINGELASIHSYVSSLLTSANAEADSVKAEETSAAQTTGAYEKYVAPTTTDTSTTTNKTSTTTTTDTSKYGKVSETSGLLKQGSSGSAVKALQYALNQLGYGNSGTSSVDGQFGSGTASAVKKFQSAMGITADGIVGSATRAKFKLKGYQSGTMSASEGLKWFNEVGSELLVKPTENSILGYFDKGDGVIPHDATKNLMSMAKDPTAFVNSAIQSVGAFGSPIGSVSSMGDTNISIAIDHVEDYDDLVSKMKNDGTFEKMIQSMTVDRLSGKSSLAKYKYYK